jgi:small-conductance mechanosensitive channel
VPNDSPEEKPLRATSFAVHATRGLIRDQSTRRKAMFLLLIIAMILLFAGSTFLQSLLNWHEHPGRFIFFWAVCAWITLTAMLLAVFDLLMVRLEARKTERAMRENFSQRETPNPPTRTRNE